MDGGEQTTYDTYLVCVVVSVGVGGTIKHLLYREEGGESGRYILHTVELICVSCHTSMQHAMRERTTRVIFFLRTSVKISTGEYIQCS